MKDNIEKSIKRWLKNKVKVTLGLMVSFLITGSIGYAITEMPSQYDPNLDIIIKDGDLKITADGEGTNGKIGLGRGGKVDVQNGNLIINAISNGIESSYGKDIILEVYANDITVNSTEGNGIITYWGKNINENT